MSFNAHGTAIVDDGAQIGDGTKIWHWVHVSAGAQIGSKWSKTGSKIVQNGSPKRSLT